MKNFKNIDSKNHAPNDPNKKIKFIICYNKLKISNLVINYNSSLSFRVLPKKQMFYINLNVL